MTEMVYVVTWGSYSDYRIDRVYLDRAEAHAFAEARNKAHDSDGYDVEEWPVGAPQAEYDGPVWEGTFRQSRVVQPNPTYTLSDLTEMRNKMHFGAGWRDLAEPPRHTGDVKDSFVYHEVWHTGDQPPKAAVQRTTLNSYQDTIYAVVRGSSREHVEKSLQDTVARLKAEKAGIA